jgi:hypothetical protein
VLLDFKPPIRPPLVSILDPRTASVLTVVERFDVFAVIQSVDLCVFPVFLEDLFVFPVFLEDLFV